MASGEKQSGSWVAVSLNFGLLSRLIKFKLNHCRKLKHGKREMEIGMEAERCARSVYGTKRNPQFHSYGSKPDRLVLGLPRHLAERSGNFCYDWVVELKGKWEGGCEGKQVGQ